MGKWQRSGLIMSYKETKCVDLYDSIHQQVEWVSIPFPLSDKSFIDLFQILTTGCSLMQTRPNFSPCPSIAWNHYAKDETVNMLVIPLVFPIWPNAYHAIHTCMTGNITFVCVFQSELKHTRYYFLFRPIHGMCMVSC